LVFSLIAVFAAFMAWREQRQLQLMPDLAGTPQTESTAALPCLVLLDAPAGRDDLSASDLLKELEPAATNTFRIETVDSGRSQTALKTFGVRTAPAWIFFDAAGKELFRQEGLMTKDQILSKWRELGVASNSVAPTATKSVGPTPPR